MGDRDKKRQFSQKVLYTDPNLAVAQYMAAQGKSPIESGDAVTAMTYIQRSNEVGTEVTRYTIYCVESFKKLIQEENRKQLLARITANKKIAGYIKLGLLLEDKQKKKQGKQQEQENTEQREDDER